MFVLQDPKTKLHLGPVERAEKALDVSALVRGAVAECWQVDVTRGAEPPAL